MSGAAPADRIHSAASEGIAHIPVYGKLGEDIPTVIKARTVLCLGFPGLVLREGARLLTDVRIVGEDEGALVSSTNLVSKWLLLFQYYMYHAENMFSLSNLDPDSPLWLLVDRLPEDLHYEEKMSALVYNTDDRITLEKLQKTSVPATFTSINQTSTDKTPSTPEPPTSLSEQYEPVVLPHQVVPESSLNPNGTTRRKKRTKLVETNGMIYGSDTTIHEVEEVEDEGSNSDEEEDEVMESGDTYVDPMATINGSISSNQGSSSSSSNSSQKRPRISLIKPRQRSVEEEDEDMDYDNQDAPSTTSVQFGIKKTTSNRHSDAVPTNFVSHSVRREPDNEDEEDERGASSTDRRRAREDDEEDRDRMRRDTTSAMAGDMDPYRGVGPNQSRTSFFSEVVYVEAGFEEDYESYCNKQHTDYHDKKNRGGDQFNDVFRESFDCNQMAYMMGMWRKQEIEDGIRNEDGTFCHEYEKKFDLENEISHLTDEQLKIYDLKLYNERMWRRKRMCVTESFRRMVKCIPAFARYYSGYLYETPPNAEFAQATFDPAKYDDELSSSCALFRGKRRVDSIRFYTFSASRFDPNFFTWVLLNENSRRHYSGNHTSVCLPVWAQSQDLFSSMIERARRKLNLSSSSTKDEFSKKFNMTFKTAMRAGMKPSRSSGKGGDDGGNGPSLIGEQAHQTIDMYSLTHLWCMYYGSDYVMKLYNNNSKVFHDIDWGHPLHPVFFFSLSACLSQSSSYADSRQSIIAYNDSMVKSPNGHNKKVIYSDFSRNSFNFFEFRFPAKNCVSFVSPRHVTISSILASPLPFEQELDAHPVITAVPEQFGKGIGGSRHKTLYSPVYDSVMSAATACHQKMLITNMARQRLVGSNMNGLDKTVDDQIESMFKAAEEVMVHENMLTAGNNNGGLVSPNSERSSMAISLLNSPTLNPELKKLADNYMSAIEKWKQYETRFKDVVNHIRTANMRSLGMKVTGNMLNRFSPFGTMKYNIGNLETFHASIVASKMMSNKNNSTMDRIIEEVFPIGEGVINNVIRKLKSTKYQRAVWLAHMLWSINKMETSYTLPNPPAIRAILEYIQTSKAVNATDRPIIKRESTKLPLFCDFLAWMSKSASEVMFLVEAQIWTISWVSALSSTRLREGMRGNMCYTGSGATSKSTIMKKVAWGRIGSHRVKKGGLSRMLDGGIDPTTTFDHGKITNAGTQTEDNPYDCSAVTMQEAPQHIFDNGTGSADDHWKNMLDSDFFTVATCDISDNRRRTMVTNVRQRAVWLMAKNWSIKLEVSIRQRFLEIMVSERSGSEYNMSETMAGEHLAKGSPENKDELNKMRETLYFCQSFGAMLEIAMAQGAPMDMDDAMAYIICSYVDRYLKSHGMAGFGPRDINRIANFARELRKIEIFCHIYMYPGSPKFGQPFKKEDLILADPMLYIGFNETATAMMLIGQYMFPQYKNEIRLSLLYHLNTRLQDWRSKNYYELENIANGTGYCGNDTVEERSFIQHFGFSPSCNPLSNFAKNETVVYSNGGNYQSNNNDSKKATGKNPPPKPTPPPPPASSANAAAREGAQTPVVTIESSCFTRDDLDKAKLIGNYDLNYVCFRLGKEKDSVEQLAIQLQACMANIQDITVKPSKMNIKDVLFSLIETDITCYPYTLSDNAMWDGTQDFIDLVVPDESSGHKRTFQAAKLENNGELLLVHTYFLKDILEGPKLIKDALKELVNHAGQDEITLLSGIGSGHTFTVETFGPGHYPSGSINHNVHTKPLMIPNIHARFPSDDRDILSGKKTEKDFENEDEYFDEINRLTGKLSDSWYEKSDMMVVECSLEKWARGLRMKEIFWDPNSIITWTDVEIALRMLRDGLNWKSVDPVLEKLNDTIKATNVSNPHGDFQPPQEPSSKKRIGKGATGGQRKKSTATATITEAYSVSSLAETVKGCDGVSFEGYFTERANCDLVDKVEGLSLENDSTTSIEDINSLRMNQTSSLMVKNGLDHICKKQEPSAPTKIIPPIIGRKIDRGQPIPNSSNNSSPTDQKSQELATLRKNIMAYTKSDTSISDDKSIDEEDEYDALLESHANRNRHLAIENFDEELDFGDQMESNVVYPPPQQQRQFTSTKSSASKKYMVEQKKMSENGSDTDDSDIDSIHKPPKPSKLGLKKKQSSIVGGFRKKHLPTSTRPSPSENNNDRFGCSDSDDSSSLSRSLIAKPSQRQQPNIDDYAEQLNNLQIKMAAKPQQKLSDNKATPVQDTNSDTIMSANGTIVTVSEDPKMVTMDKVFTLLEKSEIFKTKIFDAIVAKRINVRGDASPVVMPHDLLVEPDLDPGHYMVANPFYDRNNPDVYFNRPFIPIWRALGMSRSEWKYILGSQLATKLLNLHKDRYPPLHEYPTRYVEEYKKRCIIRQYMAQRVIPVSAGAISVSIVSINDVFAGYRVQQKIEALSKEYLSHFTANAALLPPVSPAGVDNSSPSDDDDIVAKITTSLSNLPISGKKRKHTTMESNGKPVLDYQSFTKKINPDAKRRMNKMMNRAKQQQQFTPGISVKHHYSATKPPIINSFDDNANDF